MKKNLFTTMILCSFIAFASFMTHSPLNAEVPYPEGFRNWMHVKSMVITSKDPKADHNRGYHHIYANALAMDGYKTGKYANGSIIVADFIEMIEKDGNILEGKRKFINVMVKDSEKYKTTGGWGYEEFDGDSKTLRTVTPANAAAKCYNCHTSQLQKDHVFSSLRD
ncbi:MAG TPA: cytochrome P460 family protein [Chitinophagaceae bacterium]